MKILENYTAWGEFVDFTCWAGVEVFFRLENICRIGYMAVVVGRGRRGPTGRFSGRRQTPGTARSLENSAGPRRGQE